LFKVRANVRPHPHTLSDRDREKNEGDGHRLTAAQGVEYGDWHISDSPNTRQSDPLLFETFKAQVNARLQIIEARLGIQSSDQPPPVIPVANMSRESSAPVDDSGGDGQDRMASLPDLSMPLLKLSTYDIGGPSEGLRAPVVEALWLA
jgi:hypothetical protein